MTNEEIVAKIKAGEGDKNELLLMLYNQNISLIHRFIKRYASYIDYSDALQVAFLALYTACDGYEPGRAKFFTYYHYAFMSEMRNYAGCSIYFPHHVKMSLITLEKIISQYRNKYGYEPDNIYISDTMQISLDAVNELLYARKTLKSVGSLDEVVSEDDTLTYRDTIPDPAEPVEDRCIDEIELQQLKEDVHKCLESLSNRQRIAVEDFYLYNKVTDITAEKIGVSNSRCRQIRQEGLRLLRRGNNKKILSKYRDRYNMNFYKGVGVGAFYLTNTSSTERNVMSIIEREEEMMRNMLSV